MPCGVAVKRKVVRLYSRVVAIYTDLEIHQHKHTVVTAIYIKSLYIQNNSHTMQAGPGAFVGGGAVFVPHPHDAVQANIIISDLEEKIELTHNRLQVTRGLLQPYLSDLNIMHQRHAYIDAPLVIKAREGLVTANNLLNIARFRLNGLYAMMAPGLAWTRHGVFNKGLTIHEMLHRANGVNLDNLRLFHLIDGSNNLATRAAFSNRFNGSHANTWR